MHEVPLCMVIAQASEREQDKPLLCNANRASKPNCFDKREWMLPNFFFYLIMAVDFFSVHKAQRKKEVNLLLVYSSRNFIIVSEPSRSGDVPY